MISMVAIPDDLVPLRSLAGKLGVRQARLVAMAERGAFPPIYRIDGSCRVSESAVGRWFAEQAVDVQAHRRGLVQTAIRATRGSRARR